MKIKIGTLIIVLMFCLISPVSATIIIDTGPAGQGGGASFGDDYYLAAGFNLSNDTIVTAVYGWISGEDDGVAHTAFIFSDNSGIPVNPYLYGGYYKFTGFTASWLGPTNLDWFLPAGDYWVGFGGADTKGFMPTPSTNPLSKYAYRDFFSNNTGWIRDDTLDFGVRIEGTVVPEPSTFLLLGAGLAGLGFVARRRRKE